MCSSLSLRYRQTPLRERVHWTLISRLTLCYMNTAYTFKRKQLMLNPPSLIWRTFKDRISQCFSCLLLTITLVSDCKSTNFSWYGKIKNASAGFPAEANGSIGRIYLVFHSSRFCELRLNSVDGLHNKKNIPSCAEGILFSAERNVLYLVYLITTTFLAGRFPTFMR